MVFKSLSNYFESAGKPAHDSFPPKSLLKYATIVKRGIFMMPYLFLEQWQRPEAADLPETSSECPWHFFLYEDESGGFPAETAGAGGAIRSEDACFPFETLPSPVTDDRNEFPDDIGEIVKLSFAGGWISLAGLGLGFEKSMVRV